MIPNIIVFHTNTKDKIEKFVSDKEMIYYEDKHYLGNGMYFWDNEGNAKYWANKKLKENKGIISEVYISKANLLLDETILDLTNVEIIKLVRTLWIEYCDKLDEKNRNQFIGTILDILRKYFPILNNMKVSKCHGDYSHYNKNTFLSKLGNKSFIDDRPRTIYAVTCETKIVNPELFEVMYIAV
jgi:hypothetical protein